MEHRKKKAELIYTTLKKAGINFVVTVPDSWLLEVNELIAQDPKIKYVSVAREEEGMGVAAGAALGGKHVAFTMEITGLGNSWTALANLQVSRQIPLLILISQRANVGERDSFVPPQISRSHLLLEALGIPYHVLRDEQQADKIIMDCAATAKAMRMPVAVLLSGPAVL